MDLRHLGDDQLSARLDNALDAVETQAVESHLEECSDCRARMELLGATTRAIAGLPPEELPRPLDLAFLRGQATAANDAPRGFVARVLHGRPPLWLPTAVAAAAVLVLAVTVGPRFLAGGGGGTRSATSLAGGAAAPQVRASGVPQLGAPSVAPGGPSSQDFAAPLNSRSPQKTAIGADGSTVAILANTLSATTGRPTQLVLRLVGGASGTTLAPQGMEIFIGQGSTQLRLAGSEGASPRLKPKEELDLTAEWSAGALAGPPAPGAYSLIGRVFLAGGQVVEVTLPFSVSAG